MAKPKFEDKLFVKYLNLLGINKQKPGLEALKEIIKAQLSKLPFENISKLYYKKRLNLTHLIDFELYLEGIEKYGFGGTCYSSNFFFNQLLGWLGYDIRLCGANMKNPDVHILNIATIENREFLVDVGYAAPFLEPLPLDLSSDHVVVMGDDQYVLKRLKNDDYPQIKLYRNGESTHGYIVNPLARNIREFQQVIADSFNEDATFMNALLLARFDAEHFIIIHNMTVSEFQGIKSKRYSLDSIDQLTSAIEKHFGIPKTIALESLPGLQMLKDAWN